MRCVLAPGDSPHELCGLGVVQEEGAQEQSEHINKALVARVLGRLRFPAKCAVLLAFWVREAMWM